MSQPPGFEVKGKEHVMYRLYKALSVLKQALRVWNGGIDVFFISHGFKRYSIEYDVYVNYKQGEILLLVCLYVDAFLITGESQLEIKDLNSTMN